MIVNINEILKTEFILFENVYFDYVKLRENQNETSRSPTDP